VCIDSNQNQIPCASQGQNPTRGFWNKLDYVCSTAICNTPKPTTTPTGYLPCTATSCSNWSVSSFPCSNLSTPSEATCLMTTDFSQPTVCKPGLKCIGAPPPFLPCSDCYTVGEWSKTCTANNGSIIETRTVTCADGKNCASSYKPDTTRPCSKDISNLVQIKSNDNYFGAPDGDVSQWINKAVKPRPINQALSFQVWRADTDTTFYLQDASSQLFLGLDSNGIVILLDPTVKVSWQSNGLQTQLLNSNGKPVALQSNYWVVGNGASDIQFLPSLTLPAPTYSFHSNLFKGNVLKTNRAPINTLYNHTLEPSSRHTLSLPHSSHQDFYNTEE